MIMMSPISVTHMGVNSNTGN